MTKIHNEIASSVQGDPSGWFFQRGRRSEGKAGKGLLCEELEKAESTIMFARRKNPTQDTTLGENTANEAALAQHGECNAIKYVCKLKI